jgi:hypothetical protein
MIKNHLPRNVTQELISININALQLLFHVIFSLPGIGNFTKATSTWRLNRSNSQKKKGRLMELSHPCVCIPYNF